MSIHVMHISSHFIVLSFKWDLSDLKQIVVFFEVGEENFEFFGIKERSCFYKN